MCQNTYGQLTDGSIVPDFTFTDIQGNTQNLYAYLNQGKYVAIDISATWCIPCWNYHNQKVIDSIYNKHDAPGDNTWKVLFIEADPSTTSADLQGSGSNTQGNWVQGNNYTIIDPPAGTALSDFKTAYNLSFFPTLMLICPNKRIVQDTLNKGSKPLVERWERVANAMCSLTGINRTEETYPVTIYPNPSFDITTIQFYLNKTTTVTTTIINMMGKVVAKKQLILNSGEQTMQMDVSHLQPGVYSFTLNTYSAPVWRKLIVQ